MKKTTTEQYNEWLENVNLLKKKMVSRYSRISAIYSVDKTRGVKIDKPTKWDVVNISYDITNVFSPFLDLPIVKKRATSKNVESIKKYYNELAKNGDIVFTIRRNTNYGYISCCVPLNSINNDRFSFNKNGLDETIKKHNEEYHRLFKPKDGYTACEYCGKQTPNDKLVREKIIYQDYKNGKKCVVTHDGVFCSDECAHNEQCSREG